MIGAQRLDHAAARQPREDRELRQRQRDHRQSEVAEPPFAPAAGGDPAQDHREDQRQDRPDDEVRHRQADGREGHHGVVDGAVLAERGNDARGDAAERRAMISAKVPSSSE